MFTYLNDRIEVALRDEDRGGPAPRVLETVKVQGDARLWGFTVPSDVSLAEAKAKLGQKRREAMACYRDGALKLTRSLDKAGIKPLAIITRKAWYQILRRSGLFVVETDERGYGMVSTDLVNQLRGQSRHAPMPGWSILAGIGLAIYPMLWVAHQGWSDGWTWGINASLLVAIVTTLPTTVEITWKRSWKRNYNKRVAAYTASHTWGQFLRDIVLGDGVSLAMRHNGGMYRVINLPSPPTNIVELLRKLYRYNTGDNKNEIGNKSTFNIQVAAEADAIRFRGGMAGYFDDGLKHLEVEEARLRGDPIIFVEASEVVAIVGQFGPFPIEKEVIDAVAQSEHLL